MDWEFRNKKSSLGNGRLSSSIFKDITGGWQVAFDDFHCVVVGNEPAGFWLLSELDRAFREQGEIPRLGWVPLFPGPVAQLLPSAVVSTLQGALSSGSSAELVTPSESISWNKRALREQGLELLSQPPTLRSGLEGFTSPTPADLTAIREALSRCPDLLSVAQALWKITGRAQQHAPEALVHYARFCTAFEWWEPQNTLPLSVERFEWPAPAEIESFRSTREGVVAIEFTGGNKILSKQWVFSCDNRALAGLCSPCPSFFSLLNVEWQPSALRALYPLHLLVENAAIPAPVSDLTFYFDSDTIPDPDTEIWPLTKKNRGEHQELTLWVDAPGWVSLEAVLETFRKGMARVNRLFPFLAERLLEVSVPLGMDSCHSVEYRRQVADELQFRSIEKYRFTGFRTDTRSTSLQLLMPHLGCHLPYPLGTIQAARSLVPTLLGKKKKPPRAEPPAAPAP
jgi:hypothetical protein